MESPTREESLPFGPSSITFRIPQRLRRCSVLRPKGGSDKKGRDRPGPSLVRNALARPIGSPRLSDLVRPRESVCIVISDVTRYSGAEIFLPEVVEELAAAGVRESDITVLFSTGIHRAQTDEEQRQIVGADWFGRIRCVDHDARDDRNLSEAGRLRVSRDGEGDTEIPFRINSHAKNADRLILTGCIGLHYLAGFGGGGKALLPGISSHDSCMALHKMTLNPNGPGRHPGIGPARLIGNPVQETIQKALDLVKPDFLLNTILDTTRAAEFDGRGKRLKPRIADVVAGDPSAAFRKGCGIALGLETVPIRERADLVVVSGGGTPRDINFIQSHKALDHAAHAVREGGSIVFAAECPDGLGYPSFEKWFGFPNLSELEAVLRKNFEIYGQTAFATLLKTSRYRIYFLSQLPPTVTEKMGFIPIRSVEEGIERALTNDPKIETCYVIPDGYASLPLVSSDG